MSITTNQRESAAERVYRSVKADILTGTLSGGQLLSEGEIATALGVSRTPVREGFLRLETEGWLKLYPKRGALVSAPDMHEAVHVCQSRYFVETGCIRAITAPTSDVRRRADVVAELRASLARQRDLVTAGDLAGFAAEDTHFHRTFVDAADNPILSAFYETLRERQQRMVATSIGRPGSDVPAIIDCHSALTEHLEAGDADGFATTLANHLMSVHRIDLPGVSLPGVSQ